MSAFILSKIDIDVLVQLAVYGPIGATKWTALTEDPDALGTALWQQNYEAAADPDEDPPLPEYRFEMLPFGITAVEGLKQCACYGYQTADDVDAWRDGDARPVIERLKSQLQGALVGSAEAPWGWGPDDITARMDRGGAPEPTVKTAPPPEDPLIHEVEAAFAAVGIELALPFGDPGPLSREIDPRARVGRREVRVSTIQPIPVINVEVYADEAIARAVMHTLRATHERESPLHDSRIARFGRVIITYFQLVRRKLPAHLKDGITALGTPDELWTSADPPIAVGGGAVLATRLPMTASESTRAGTRRVVVGHDATSLQALAALVGDDNVREGLRSVDLERQTALLLVGIASVDSVDAYSLHGRVDAEDPEPFVEMRLTTTGVTSLMMATALIVDRLPVMPSRASLTDPGGAWTAQCAED